MNCKDLVGYALVSICDTHIVVRKGDTEYTLNIDEDYGDCCGYNEINTKLFVSETELGLNPIITNVELDNTNEYYGDRCKLTFFGGYKPLAIVDAFSSSGSGWCYGACVTISCDALKLNETLSSY
jgi:hypothetical protein